MNKEIQKIKIALTSDCTLRCTHCKVDKNLKKTISLNNAIRAVKILVDSPNDYKVLELYGGEPFLRFDLMKKIVNFALEYAKLRKKHMAIHVATNATLLNDDNLRWAKEKNIFVAISFSGSAKSHNLNRKFPNGDGSFKVVKKNILKAIEILGSSKIACLYCVDNSFVRNMFYDFKKIVSLGFKMIDIECVHGSGWKEKDYLLFEKQFKKISDFIFKKISESFFLFPESFIEYVRLKNIETPACPAYMDTEVYPDGNIGFYSHAFLNYEKYKKKIIVGNVKNGFSGRFKKCFYPYCSYNNCIRNYYKFDWLSDGSIAYHQIRNRLSKELFLKILKESNKNISYKNYIKELLKTMKLLYNSM